MRKNVILLGATGSIGQSTLEVIRKNPQRLNLLGIANNRKAAELQSIAEEFSVPHQVCCQRDGIEKLIDLVTLAEADIVVVAAVGTVGLKPTLAAIEARKTIALASKEVLVMAGRFVMEAARKRGVKILPIDSEHNAIFQCLHQEPERHIKKLILTASGGAFRNYSKEQMQNITPEDAMKHPNWDMGPKITIDSSTMANKGLEMIEARWLFNVDPDQIQVVVHPQSLVHSMVEFVDGSILAQLSPPSMTFAIQYSLLYPDRLRGVHNALDFSQCLHLDFSPPDYERFPCLALARRAMNEGGILPAVYNAANEEAVAAFSQNKLPYFAIPEIIEYSLSQIKNCEPDSLETVINYDREARILTQSKISQKCQSIL